ncbi:flavodoxin [Candidatus Saccharibacteria bacterium]|nr:flavodoxin [Candidatus Saccharibacteria bacterium]
MGKILVVYYSRGDENYNVGTITVGNTELLAKEIVAKTGADEFKIEPKVPYPASYQESVEKATEELTAQARPEYIGDIDISEYDTIFLGYPIWWGDLPMVVYSFLEKHDFTGKTVIPFNTHEGSGNAGTYEKLKEKLSNANVIGEGFNMTGVKSRKDEGIQELDAWLKTLNI